MSIDELLGNQVFAGVAGAAVISAVLFQLRTLPQLLWSLLCTQFSATLTVYSEQEAYRQIDLWLGKHPSASKTRRLSLTEWWEQGADRMAMHLTPGEGPHLLWEGREPVFVNKVVEAAAPGAMPGVRRQTITLTTIGRSRSLLERIMDEARSVQDRDVVPIHVWGGHSYQLVERRQRRAVSTIQLPGGLREQILDDAKRFVGRASWYARIGVPHRRGYLFEGPPGTGKSSMALALAGELGRAIYIINPSAVSDDNSLQAALNQAGAGVVLIEDIDAVDCGRERSAQLVGPGVPTVADANATGISTSGLLNAIDGVAARDGRILIITSNHPDKLDAALIRPGRVDMRCHFGLAGEEEAREMFRRFCPDGDEEAFIRATRKSLPLSQAELQSRLLRIAA